MRTSSEELLEYYGRELTYLRRMGAAFAAQYPKVAGWLELGADQCPDPHIERLIESFALLTARLQHDIEGEFPELTSALLGILYPQFLNPVPSMSVARFEVDPDKGKITTGHTIPKHTPLFAQSEQGQICRFRTCYPVVLWPLGVAYAGLESTAKYDFLDTLPDVALVLRIRIETMADPLSELDFKRLRFFLNGDRMLVNSLYELLFTQIFKIALWPDKNNRPIFLPPESILPVGFTASEEVLPYPSNAHYGYRLLQEYFTFPEKYLFFDLDHLDLHASDTHFDILILLDRMPEGRLVIDQNTFCLGCAPIINLFPKTTDPIRVDERHFQYRLNPDKRREKTTEIHSIRSVSTTSDVRDEANAIEPFFSYNHRMQQGDHKAYWIGTRQATGRPDLPGTEMLLAFMDLDFNPFRVPSDTVYAHTLCTNRHLAEELPAGAILQIERAAPLALVTMLTKPTFQIEPPSKGMALWRLISHLSLNYLSLSDSHESLKALREILKLYSVSDASDTLQQIKGIRQMSCKKVMRWIGSGAWRGLCRGTEVTLLFDDRLYVGSSAFLLASVLNRFFPLYASINSFTQLIIKSIQHEGIWKKWPSMVGEQPVL